MLGGTHSQSQNHRTKIELHETTTSSVFDESDSGRDERKSVMKNSLCVGLGDDDDGDDERGGRSFRAGGVKIN
jgi:hypothetical protein